MSSPHYKLGILFVWWKWVRRNDNNMIKWMLKVCDSDNHKESFIVHNAKYHCCVIDTTKDISHTVSGTSMCGKYTQDMDYDFGIEEIDLSFENKSLCKKCLTQYLQQKK